MSSPRPNRAMFDLTSKFDSLYPPSSPSANSEVEYSSLALRTSIAAVPDSKLRAIIIKLAESSPQFHRSIMKELGNAEESSPTTPTTPTPYRRERRRSKSSHRKALTISTHTSVHNRKQRIDTATETSIQSDRVYHPGNLEEEADEFLSGSLDDLAKSSLSQVPAHKMVGTISMWGCCDEDEWGSECMSATMIPSQFMVDHDDHCDAHLSHDDVFPDSDLEERLDLSSRLLSQTR